MKKPLFLNRRLYELELLEQNKYLGEKINKTKPVIITKAPSQDYKHFFSNTNSSKMKSTYFL